MTWRRIPPVSSPIAPLSLVSAAASAFGFMEPPRDEVSRLLEDNFDALDVLLTASGTEALTLAIRATAPAGAIVAMPGYVCIDLITAAQGSGVRVALYDVDPTTLSPDPESVRGTLRRGARAIVVAPLYGYPVHMQTISAIAEEAGVPVIEDAAQAAGATLDRTPVGSFGDLTVLSFGRGKGMTGGSGGALLIRQANFLDWGEDASARLLKAASGVQEIVALSAQLALGRPQTYTIPASIPALGLGEMIYKPPREPRAISMAAVPVLRAALRLNPAEVETRRRVARELTAAHARTNRFTAIAPVAGANPGYLRFATLDARGDARPNASLGALRGYPISLDEHVETKRVLVEGQPDLPGARVLRDRLFTLPTHSMVTAADIARLSAWLSSG